jgi:hypothetical protein
MHSRVFGERYQTAVCSAVKNNNLKADRATMEGDPGSCDASCRQVTEGLFRCSISQSGPDALNISLIMKNPVGRPSFPGF